MPEVKKNVKKMSDHAKKKARRRAEIRDGYEYQMSQKYLEFLTSDEGAGLRSKEAIIKYLNASGNFIKPIVRYSVV